MNSEREFSTEITIYGRKLIITRIIYLIIEIEGKLSLVDYSLDIKKLLVSVVENGKMLS